MIGKILVFILGTPLVALVIFFCWKAAAMMEAEMEREALRKTTQAAMRYDRHMARLKRAGMKAQYRRERVW